MPATEVLIGVAMMVSLTFYALLGGADYGGGVWDRIGFERHADQGVALATAEIAANQDLAAANLAKGVDASIRDHDILADDLDYLTYSAALGWTIKPGGRGESYRANAQGIRADREFARVPPPGSLRIAAFGPLMER